MSEWKTVRLGDVCILEKGQQIDTSLLDDSKPYRYINGGIKESGYFDNFNTSGESVLISEGGASCGYINYVNENFWCGCHCYRLHDIKVFPKYLFHALKANQQRIMALRTGSAMPNIQKSTIQKFELKIHDDSTSQKKVAIMLDKCNELIEKHKQTLEKYDLLIKSRFIEMFGDLAKNPKNWEIKNFKDCAIIDTKMVKDFDRYADYPHIGIDSIEKETGVLSGYRTVKEDNVISGKYLFTSEHIIYSKIRPNLNKVAMPNFAGLCSADAYPILVKKEVVTREYLTYTMRSDFYISYILTLSRRANMPKVNKEQVESFNLPVPPLALQQQFAAFVQQIDKSKFTVQKSLEKAETLYKSLMQEYFE